MPKPSLSLKEINQIKNLRKTGHTLYEIKNILKRSNGTVWKYIKDISVLPNYQETWKAKKGGSKARSIHDWQTAKDKASGIVKNLKFKDKMLILSCLYWGEGNKSELNIINSDPDMIRVFIFCLKELGVREDELKVSLRLFNGINKSEAILFWSKTLSLPCGFISKIEIIHGNKVGKLKYGMCRLRVKKGGKYFKLLMSMIDLIKSHI